nr:LOW QUALITY PROTEIN: heat shock 70 kDa protein C-like [Caretta caretta]
MDAFLLPWGDSLMYVFPLVALVYKMLLKICRDKVEVILLAPAWPPSTLVHHASRAVSGHPDRATTLNRSDHSGPRPPPPPRPPVPPPHGLEASWLNPMELLCSELPHTSTQEQRLHSLDVRRTLAFYIERTKPFSYTGDGHADVIPSDAGDRVTPAVVAYSKNKEVVGLTAKQSRGRNIANTVVKIKKILGRSSGDPQAEKYIAESKCPVTEKNGKLQYETDNKLVCPEEVAKLIFSKMKEIAQSPLGSNVNDVVITARATLTVPFEFGENQKNALGQVAWAAGFNVLRLIHESSAPLFAYGIGQDSPTGKSNVLVFKLNGASLSVIVIEINRGIYRVLATNTDDSIAGVCFTEDLAQHLASEFQRSYKHDTRGNFRAMMKLMNSTDVAKHSLSTLGSANCYVNSLYYVHGFLTPFPFCLLYTGNGYFTTFQHLLLLDFPIIVPMFTEAKCSSQYMYPECGSLFPLSTAIRQSSCALLTGDTLVCSDTLPEDKNPCVIGAIFTNWLVNPDLLELKSVTFPRWTAYRG